MINKNKKTFSRDELKDALKKFKANTDDVQVMHNRTHFPMFVFI